MRTSSDDVPNAPIFPGLRSAARRRVLVPVLSVFALTTLALIWPVYPAVSGIQPYLFGLPFSFAWVVGWLLLTFAALALLYWSERSRPDGR